MWFATKPCDFSFAETAATHIHFEFPVKASSERLFEIMSTGENQTVWAKGYLRTHWHTPPPHGVGTVRDIVLENLSVRERFIAWDVGKRVAFSSDALTLPIASRLMEDIKFEAVSEHESLLVWNVYYTAIWWLLPFNGLLTKRVFEPMFRQFATGFAKYAEQHS